MKALGRANVAVSGYKGMRLWGCAGLWGSGSGHVRVYGEAGVNMCGFMEKRK